VTRSSTPGKNTSASVENITPFGLWMLVGGKEYFLPCRAQPVPRALYPHPLQVIILKILICTLNYSTSLNLIINQFSHHGPCKISMFLQTHASLVMPPGSGSAVTISWTLYVPGFMNVLLTSLPVATVSSPKFQ